MAYLRLRYAAPGHPDDVEGVDRVDAPSVSALRVGSPVVVTIATDAPRAPRLLGAERSYWWRNVRDEILIIIGMLGMSLVIAGVLKRRQGRGEASRRVGRARAESCLRRCADRQS